MTLKKVELRLKIMLANSLREDVCILIFRPEILNRTVSIPHQLAQEVVP